MCKYIRLLFTYLLNRTNLNIKHNIHGPDLIDLSTISCVYPIQNGNSCEMVPLFKKEQEKKNVVHLPSQIYLNETPRTNYKI